MRDFMDYIFKLETIVSFCSIFYQQLINLNLIYIYKYSKIIIYNMKKICLNLFYD